MDINKGGHIVNLYHLRYFVTLAEMKHYTRAAEYLCISQPSLSHAIRQMEKELGVALFEKEGRHTLMTRFGEEFLEYARQSLAVLDEGVASLQRSSRGEGLIRLGFVRPLGVDFVPRLAADFLKVFPDRDIRFTFHTDLTEHLLAGLAAKKFDIVFASQPEETDGLTAVPVENQELVLITPKGHPLACADEISLSDTEGYRQVFFDRSSGIRRVIEKMFDDAGILPDIAYETEEDQVIAGLVAKGFGIAVVPYMDMLHKLDVEIMKIKSPSHERRFLMVTDDHVFIPPAAVDFMNFVKEKCMEKR